MLKKGKIEKKDLFQPSVLFLIAANLIPVYGVLYFEWKVFAVILLFWSENVVIGFFNVLRMLLSEIRNPLKWIGKVFLIPFFCFHYGMFTAIHGLFLVILFSGVQPQGSPEDMMNRIPGFIFEYRLEYAVLAVVVSHAFSFIYNYILKGEYRRSKLEALMGLPYTRVIILHLTIIFGGFILMSMGSPVLGLILFIFIKIYMDVKLHKREHKKNTQKKDPQIEPNKKIQEVS